MVPRPTSTPMISVPRLTGGFFISTATQAHQRSSSCVTVTAEIGPSRRRDRRMRTLPMFGSSMRFFSHRTLTPRLSARKAILWSWPWNLGNLLSRALSSPALIAFSNA